MDGHLVFAVAVVEGDVGVMEEVVGEPLLDILLLITSTDDKLIEFHKSHGKLATLTAVKMAQDKGVLDIENGAVRAFREKNAIDGAPINAGYMVLEPQIFDLLDGDSCVFEKIALTHLATEGQLMSYVHTGFWQCMDNIREKNLLEKLLAEGKAPWKQWDRIVPNVPDYAK